jgi:hypothetical protein
MSGYFCGDAHRRLQSIAHKFIFLLFLSLLPAALFAQMVNPAIDAPNQPFSYYSEPTDVIGVMDAPTATLVSPEGFLYTGYGELMFFTGNPQVAIAQRVKTLLRGYLPVIQYSFVREGIRYSFTDFAATLDGRPSGTLVDFIRVQIQNENAESRTAWISSGMRYEGNIDNTEGHADNRYQRPYVASHLGGYSQMGTVFDSNWKYSSGRDAIERDRKIVYYFPPQPHTVRYTLKSNPVADGALQPQVLTVLPTSPVGVVQYKLPLKAGHKITLDWKLPVVPISDGSPEAAKVRAASFDEYLPRTINFWESVLHNGMDISVPEAKVDDTFKASLVYDLIARNKVGDQYIQTVNDFHYHAFWLRDASYITHMYDLTGYPQYARQVLNFFPRWQQPDGNFVSQGGQFDGVGQVLWVYGEHYRITHDRQFAEEVFPSVAKAVAWIKQARQDDPLHLLPATKPGDNEAISGHITGHNFLALDGLKSAIVLANASGHPQEAKEFLHEYDDYRTTFIKVLERVTKNTGGYIPPGLDGQHGGQDWGNMLAIYPEIVLPPYDPMVTATLNTTRAKYKEGIMTYDDGQYLHDYLTFKNVETEIVRENQKLAVGDLYATLLHTSSTHAGFEYLIEPWGNRDFGNNLSPHGWYAAEYRIALRNMLVREQGSDLHLLSAISPEWIQRGEEIRVANAPTDFGMVDLSLKSLSDTRAQITFHASFADAPRQIILHLPWFMEVKAVIADGQKLTITDEQVVLPLTVKTVRVDWKTRPGAEPVSYQATVAQYKVEYAKRYQEFMRTGNR